MRQLRFAALLAAGTILLVAAVNPHVAIPHRQDGMKAMGRTLKGISDQLKASSPDAQAVKLGSAQLAQLARQVPSLFPVGTGPDTGIKTAVKPAVWTNPADFHAKAAALANATDALAAAAAKGSDPANLMPLLRQVGGACKACHDTYKTPDH